MPKFCLWSYTITKQSANQRTSNNRRCKLSTFRRATSPIQTHWQTPKRFGEQAKIFVGTRIFQSVSRQPLGISFVKNFSLCCFKLVLFDSDGWWKIFNFVQGAFNVFQEPKFVCHLDEFDGRLFLISNDEYLRDLKLGAIRRGGRIPVGKI